MYRLGYHKAFVSISLGYHRAIILLLVCCQCINHYQFSLVLLLSHVWLFAIPWTAACQASLSITNSWSLLKLMSTELVIPSNHFIFCCPLLLLPSIFPSIRVFSNESTLHMRWPKYWSFSFSIIPSKEIPGRKLDVVKQEMASVNIKILGISELKWMGMGKFNSDNHYIYYCGQESFRRNGVAALIVNERVWNAVLVCNLKNDRMILIHFQGKPFNIK